MRLGIRFDGFSPTSDSLEVVRRAEGAGASHVWMAEHLGYREALVSAMAYLMATTRATVIPTAVSPYLWHPMPTAMSLATMAELAPGRVGVAVGVGNPLFLEESGVQIARPIRAVREYIECLRALWMGEPVHYQGEMFRLAGARLAFRPSEPVLVYIAAMGDQMLGLTGRIGDGVVLSAGLAVPFVGRCLALIDEAARGAGRDPAAVRKAGFLYFSVSEDGRAAVEYLRRKLAFLFRNRHMAANIRASGIPIDHDAIIDAVKRRDLDAAARLVPDEAVEAFAVGGTPRQCAARLAAYADAGLTEPVIEITGTPENRARGLAIVRAVTAT
jgi:5,10-methylenetetrahydromethanopterin reductase